MTLLAFNNDVAKKAQLIEPVRAQWAARDLLPFSSLKWMPEKKIYSLSAAFIESDDRALFIERTGIPIELAMLCESLMGWGSNNVPDESRPNGIALQAEAHMLAFGMEWLDAIRPGADLSGVVPAFMLHFLTTVLDADFVMAAHIESELRAAAATILSIWQREQSGQQVDPKEWRAARAVAVLASENCTDPWCFPIGSFIESLAWPPQAIAEEFISVFDTFVYNWMNYLARPFMVQEDRDNQVHALIGWRQITIAEQESELDEAAVEALFSTIPDSKRAIYSVNDPVIRDRVRAAKLASTVTTHPILRNQMDLVLQLISKC